MESQVFMMDIQRFTSLAEAYGGDFERWPERDRAAAQALYATSIKAQEVIASELSLDRDIASVLKIRDDEAALTGAAERLTHSVMTTIRQMELQQNASGNRRTRLWRRLNATYGRIAERFDWRFATAGLCMLSGAGGIWLGFDTPDHLLDPTTATLLTVALNGGGL
ncbi:hypothetical protein [Asaia prunellae]|uniref:hypothetical protein n=1 Tax=Asaia prunellae TaxID=610245 RepID=UPI00046E8248|nr:hypothetical protein [Asaia prunellae]